jgi:tetratricopeptide (TPR) repeat protein
MQIEQINSLYYEGNALCCSERFDEAIKYYDKIIDMTPDSKIAWGYKAHVLSKLKKYDEAFACYQKALKC